ncbi:Peptidyl-prolyl cis-trans isomerase [Diplonema papillatum]|nr:Peptidyl-prolyl cis-trans isomerase [Diplonema papillatum]
MRPPQPNAWRRRQYAGFLAVLFCMVLWVHYSAPRSAADRPTKKFSPPPAVDDDTAHLAHADEKHGGEAELAKPHHDEGEPRSEVVEFHVAFDGKPEVIVIELWPKIAPVTVANFVALVEKQYFDGKVFYRAEPGFVLQGGGRDVHGHQKSSPFKPIVLEAKTKNVRGTIAMARTNDPNSASTEFFINLNDNVHLDPRPAPQPNGYAAFGMVIEGMDLIDQLSHLPTTVQGGLKMLSAPIEYQVVKMRR